MSTPITDETTVAILGAMRRIQSDDRTITEDSGRAILALLRRVERVCEADPIRVAARLAQAREELAFAIDDGPDDSADVENHAARVRELSAEIATLEARIACVRV